MSVETRELKEPVGVVVNCLSAYIFERPDTNSDVVSELRALSNVLINEEESTDSFYKIYTATSMEGYCPKKYIAV